MKQIVPLHKDKFQSIVGKRLRAKKDIRQNHNGPFVAMLSNQYCVVELTRLNDTGCSNGKCWGYDLKIRGAKSGFLFFTGWRQFLNNFEIL